MIATPHMFRTVMYVQQMKAKILCQGAKKHPGGRREKSKSHEGRTASICRRSRSRRRLDLLSRSGRRGSSRGGSMRRSQPPQEDSRAQPSRGSSLRQQRKAAEAGSTTISAPSHASSPPSSLEVGIHAQHHRTPEQLYEGILYNAVGNNTRVMCYNSYTHI